MTPDSKTKEINPNKIGYLQLPFLHIFENLEQGKDKNTPILPGINNFYYYYYYYYYLRVSWLDLGSIHWISPISKKSGYLAGHKLNSWDEFDLKKNGYLTGLRLNSLDEFDLKKWLPGWTQA